jgi:hypothetical protein
VCLLSGILSATAGCSSGTSVHIRPCTAAAPVVSLNQFQYVSIDPATDSGCALFPATTAQAAEYLVVPQLATGVPAQTAAFRLVGDTIIPPTLSAPGPSADLSGGPAEQFHRFLRLGDERRFWGFAPEIAPRAPAMAPAVASGGPPAVNSLRKFMVCATTDCGTFNPVTARVRVVRNKIAIYVDTLAPGGGLDSVSLATIANTFDQRLYPIDTTAFGRESDIDSNSVVLVLMTNTVNKLVTKTQCTTTGFVAGFFFGADLDPAFRNDPRSNKGEIFYSLVPDPAGTLSCPHSGADLQAILPVTFIHEFQHMISFGQHVIARGGSGEVLWLNEGFSHYAEELGGRSYEATPDSRIADCSLGQAPCQYYVGDLYNAYKYLDSTSQHFLLPTAGIGTLAERGAAWLFVRYVVDHYAAGSTRADWDALTRSLEQTSNTGAANIAAVTGEPFATTVSRWVLAPWLTDISGAPSELRYNSWALHSVYASLHSQSGTFSKAYPLVPTMTAGRGLTLSGTLRAGSGVYALAEQSAGDPGFTLSFTAPSGDVINAVLVPRLNVIRLQ